MVETAASTAVSSSRRPGAGSRRGLVRDIALALVLAAAGPAVVLGPGLLRPVVDRQGAALRTELASGAMRDLAPAYAAHGFRPIWIEGGEPTPAVRALLAALGDAGADGLDPANYHVSQLAAEAAGLDHASTGRIADADLRLSDAYAQYAADLHTPAAAAAMVYADPAIAPPAVSRGRALMDLVHAPSTLDGLGAGLRMNPIYQSFRRELAAALANLPPSDERVRLLAANLERARALPADLGPRYLIVDVAAQRLWAYAAGAYQGSMKVIVGKPRLPTPTMTGVIRYAVFNPYWNVPPDLTRDKFAPRFAANPRALAALRLEVLTDSTPSARQLDPAMVDWRAVEEGAQSVWLRQLPGPGNMMGQVKFVLPNNLGIYLHDTPERALFHARQRTFSSGCVRLEDARRLAAWLVPGRSTATEPAPETRVDLAAPVPVYIAYFTADPGFEGAKTRRRDIYGRDRPLLAQLEARGRGAQR